MSFTVETVSPSQKRIDFVVPQGEVAQKVADAFKGVTKKAQLPGFRPGKVPRKVLEDRYGKQIRQDAAADLMDFHFRLAAQDVEFLGQPKVTNQGTLSENGDYTFSVLLEVRPEVTVNDYKGLVIDFPVAEVTEEQVNLSIRQRLQAQARLTEAAEDHEIVKGDLVLTQIHEQDGDGWKEVAPGTLVNTAGDRYYPGVEDLLIGAKKGDVRSGQVGEKTLQVTVLGVQVSGVPELTDEVAAKAGYEGGADGMRVAIRMELEARNNEAARNQARVEILQRITAANPVEVPTAMSESHYQLLVEELKIQNTYRGRNPQTLRLSDAQKADLQRRATFAAHASILLEAIANQEGIKVTEEDLDAKYQEIADMRGQRVEAIRGYFVKENAVPELKKRILEERTLDWLLEASELKAPEAASTESSEASV